jgi:hypothetical protein
MNNDFFNLSQDEQLAFIRQAGDKLDISDVIIEKDFLFDIQSVKVK